jgi:hypothetical protein
MFKGTPRAVFPAQPSLRRLRKLICESWFKSGKPDLNYSKIIVI